MDARGSMAASLYHPDLKLSARELLENDRVAQKINGATDFVLLEDAEYQKLLHAFEVIRGFEITDVELVKRVLNAKEVNVREE